MDWSIRTAHPDDAQAIADISNAIVRDTLVTFSTITKSAADVAASLAKNPKAFLVAATVDGVVGFATYGPFRGGPGYRHTQELTIHLAPEARRRGIGRALLSALEEVARGEDVHVLVSGISAVNPNAIAFHAAQGFVEVGRMPEVGRKWDQWLDLVLMQKRVSAGAESV